MPTDKPTNVDSVDTSQACTGKTNKPTKKRTSWKNNCKPFLNDIHQDLVDGLTIVEICEKYCFTRAAFYKWIEKYEELKEIVESSREVVVGKLKKTMFGFATDKDPKVRSAAVKAGETLLKAYAPDEFAERVKQDINHTQSFEDMADELDMEEED